MADYFQTMDERPDRLYRKPNTLEFVDKNNVVYFTGENPPPDYQWRAVRQPLTGPQWEVYVLGEDAQ